MSLGTSAALFEGQSNGVTHAATHSASRHQQKRNERTVTTLEHRAPRQRDGPAIRFV